MVLSAAFTMPQMCSMAQARDAMIGVNVVDPNYFDEVKLSPMFIPACLVVAGLLIANLFVMRALVNIKV